MKIILILLCIIGLFIIGMAWLNQMFLESSTMPQAPVVVACTLDALVCPDGTTLSRQGPNCEFPACP